MDYIPCILKCSLTWASFPALLGCNSINSRYHHGKLMEIPKNVRGKKMATGCYRSRECYMPYETATTFSCTCEIHDIISLVKYKKRTQIEYMGVPMGQHWETLTFGTLDIWHSCILLIGNRHSVISLSADILNQPTLSTDTEQGLFWYPGTPNTHLITLRNGSELS